MQGMLGFLGRIIDERIWSRNADQQSFFLCTSVLPYLRCTTLFKVTHSSLVQPLKSAIRREIEEYEWLRQIKQAFLQMQTSQPLWICRKESEIWTFPAHVSMGFDRIFLFFRIISLHTPMGNAISFLFFEQTHSYFSITKVERSADASIDLPRWLSDSKLKL